MKSRALTGLVVACAIASCYREEVSPDRMRPAAGVREGQSSMGQDCPTVVRGARVQLQETHENLALAFTSPTGELPRLRPRVWYLAHLYQTCTQRISVRVDELPVGAKIVFTPLDAADVAPLRDRLGDDSVRMSEGTCWVPCEAAREAMSGSR
jgi:hypothetical protein